MAQGNRLNRSLDAFDEFLAEFVERFPLRTLSSWSAAIVRREGSQATGSDDDEPDA